MRRRPTLLLALAAAAAALPAVAQQPDCSPGRDLLVIPEIRSQNGLLQGVLMLSDEQRSIASSSSGTPCRPQQLRYFLGYSTQEPRRDWPSTGDPIPGPTLRAKVGDMVQLAFLNHIDTSQFANTLDLTEQGKADGCDEARATRVNFPDQSVLIYPSMAGVNDLPGDVYPNCFHGSSTANVHFHGTHTTPSTTGDNVLLFIRPALRVNGELQPSEAFVREQFDDIFARCAAEGPPHHWDQLPAAWRDEQQKLLQTYDRTAPYKGVPGDLPPDMRLWPPNAERLAQGKWPQYSVGAYPYCFPLPAYDPAKVRMGQSPGTHWYHAHKHGSTALNVGNGMTGVFVIEGDYDEALRRFYRETPQRRGWGLEERVLMIQQIDAGLQVMSPTNKGGPAPLSVNGRLNPVLTMKPNQVQLWRIVNAAPRSFVQFYGFTERGQGGNSPAWRQTAQDGVQFAFANYQLVGAENARFNLAAANRADLLVRAPAHAGDYELQIVESVSDVPGGSPKTLLTVRVEGDAVEPPMDFIQDEADFPKQPLFLADITGPIYMQRQLVFNTVPGSERKGRGQMPFHEVNGKLFDGEHVDQTMILDTDEEWTVSNRTTDIAHPFHIHINPFQIVELFQPNLAEVDDPTDPCYVNPTDPSTWKACAPLPRPWVWWDTFAIPTGRAVALPSTTCTTLDGCPADIQEFTTCTENPDVCTVTIPGYFKMRSRFVDFTGQYVQHCHILAHEDRGMMQLLEVVSNKTVLVHH
ncbi:MAG TPA: multicopper oxidase domain-containing protein [Thermoanaerobaculia bacterium]|nr:multicopper oxidase domain-containing protein [Thermoanaerobaculia bacterium]